MFSLRKKYFNNLIEKSKLFLLTFILLFVIQGCEEKLTDAPLGNKPPKTGVFLYPDSTISSQPSRLKISWWGDDPDGLVIGYYFTWDNVNWHFTTSNDSTFSLQVGEADTNYVFKIAAIDNSGNGVYDNQVIRNSINFGPEPFIDLNGNGVYDVGEPFTDIGAVDPNPAQITIPIRNSAPTIQWSVLTVLPSQSFPVMSFSWEAADIDGDATINKINIALNDTSNPSSIVSLNGEVRTITIRVRDYNSANPLADILIEGLETNVAPEKLPGMILNGNNKFFVQVEDDGGAKSNFIQIPGEGVDWFVKKPVGDFLVVDDYATVNNAPNFYNAIFDSIGLTGKFDIYDYKTYRPPFLNVTFYETLKLFKYIFWYSDTNPAIDLASGTVPKFLDGGGKIFFSMQFGVTAELSAIQGFLPMIQTDSSSVRTSLLNNTLVSAQNNDSTYPDLVTGPGIFAPRSFYLNDLGVNPLYYFPNGELSGHIGFSNTNKSMFFIGLPLHLCNNGPANVKQLFNKVLFEDFGMTP